MYSYYLNLLNFFIPIITFNLKDSVLRFRSHYSSNYWVSVFVLSVFSMFIYFFIFIIFNPWFLTFFFLGIYNLISSYLRASDKYLAFNLQRVLPFFFLFVLTIVFSPKNHEFLLFLTGTSYLLSVIFSIKGFLPFAKFFDSISLNRVYIFSKSNLSYSLPTVLSVSALWGINSMDQMFLKYFYDFEYLSNYMASFRIVNIYKVLLSVFLIIYPTFYFNNFKNIDLIKKRRFQISFISFLIFLFCVIFSKFCFYLFDALNYYDESYYIFIFLLGSEFFKFLISLRLTVLSQLKRTDLVSYYYLIFLLGICFFHFFLIPIYGDLGASIISLGVSFIFFIISCFISKKYEV
ncbi:hypothetical protein CLV31_1102 [Algoriphagus aquaeductus]|uniref:Polysaccharide biosynthesis protein n=1 Tax=Algoriphagus aquaeductus TaxID=475299 RepID=A0A326RNS1_9BACT|nr:hypothetical protein CLV31_1102 [Algoriphagus aquaeductus]